MCQKRIFKSDYIVSINIFYILTLKNSTSNIFFYHDHSKRDHRDYFIAVVFFEIFLSSHFGTNKYERETLVRKQEKLLFLHIY